MCLVFSKLKFMGENIYPESPYIAFLYSKFMTLMIFHEKLFISAVCMLTYGTHVDSFI